MGELLRDIGEKMVRCLRCGEENLPGSISCANCGARLFTGKRYSLAKRTRIVLVILFICVPLLAVYFYSYMEFLGEKKTGGLPSVEEVLCQYDEEVRPLTELVEMAQEAPPDFQMPSITECQIILVPLNERLYYVQALLFPELIFNKSKESVKLYVAYKYERGGALGWGIGVVALHADTQSVKAEVLLMAEIEGRLYLIEKKEGFGGVGSSSYKDLVMRAVEPLEALNNKAKEIETVLETIIGYAAGLDWDTSLELERRMALLQWALTSQNWADQKQAVEALGRIGPEAKEAVPALIETLKDEDWYVRKATAYALRDIKSKEAIPALIETLKSEDWYVREAAALALGWIGPEAKEAVPALIEALKDEKEEVRWHVAEALGRIGPEAKEAVPALIEALKDEKEEVRKAAAEALGRIGPEAREATPALIEALKDEDWYVRKATAYALGDIKSKEATPALIETLKDEKEEVREAAAYALGKIGPEEGVVPALIEALKDEYWEVRKAAAEALGNIGPEAREAIPALIEALKDRSGWGGDVREAAAEALKAITGQDFGQSASRWQQWWEEQEQEVNPP